MKRTVFLCGVMVLAFMAANIDAYAQRETSSGVEIDKNIELLRRDLRSEKKKILAANVPLTETEATKFWPVYDEYAEAMRKHNDEFYAVIKEYAANQKTLTDPQAMSLLKRWSELQVQIAQTRQKYIPLVEKVIPGKKAALFFQIDRRLYAAMDLQTFIEIPLITQ